MTLFDCIVVGAGPAGATAAYHLAKLNRSVLLIEKAALPRHKPCGGGVSPAVAQWFDFDFESVIESRITQVRYSWKQDDAIVSSLGKVEPMWMVKRNAFDHLIAQQAEAQGAQILSETEVTGIQDQGEQWQVQTSGDTYQGRYLVAADGVKGPLADWLGFKGFKQFPSASLEIKTDVTTEQQQTAYFDFGTVKNGYIWNFPKVDGFTISASFLRGRGKPAELKKQIFNYAEQFGLTPSQGQFYEYEVNLWQDNQSLDRGRALLVGEAAGVLDPLTGEGNRPAIFTGVTAASAIAKALDGDAQALSGYSETIASEWGTEMVLANRLAGLFYQFPKIAYKVGVKRPAAAQIMRKILCVE
ncbi:MAG: geranylgeranyl reductase family protein [Cyanobacteria bacterium P01_H01_bin.15]